LATVLCTGSDKVLMQTRAMILEQAGHKVIPTMNEKDLVAACKKHRFDVAVIGQGLSHNMKHKVVGLVRQNCPTARILELFNVSDGRGVHDADDWLLVPHQFPEHLVERVTALAERKK
jgi:CheY-like chemotaxis protein